MYKYTIEDDDNKKIINQVKSEEFCNELKEVLNDKKPENTEDSTNIEKQNICNNFKINYPECFDNEILNNYKKIDNELSNNLNNIQNENSLLINQLQMAMKSFDIEHATQINNKIKENNQLINQQKNDINKYNAEILAVENEYLKELDNQKAKEKSQKMIDFAKQYFLNMPENEALEQLQSSKLIKNLLGQDNVEELIKLLG